MNPVNQFVAFSGLTEMRRQENEVERSITDPYFDPEAVRVECDYAKEPKLTTICGSTCSVSNGTRISHNLNLVATVPISKRSYESAKGRISLYAQVPVSMMIWSVECDFEKESSPQFFASLSADRFAVFLQTEKKFQIFELTTGKELFSVEANPYQIGSVEVRGESLFYTELEQSFQNEGKETRSTANFCRVNLKTGEQFKTSVETEDLYFGNVSPRNNYPDEVYHVVVPILFPEEPEKFGIVGISGKKWCWWTLESANCSKISKSFLAALDPTTRFSLEAAPNASNFRAFSNSGRMALISSGSDVLVTDCGEVLRLAGSNGGYNMEPRINARKIFPSLPEFPFWFQTLVGVNFITERFIFQPSVGVYDFANGTFNEFNNFASPGPWSYSTSGKHYTTKGVVTFPPLTDEEKCERVFRGTLKGAKLPNEAVYSLLNEGKLEQVKRTALLPAFNVDGFFLGGLEEVLDEKSIKRLRERGALFTYEELTGTCKDVLETRTYTSDERERLKRLRSGLSYLLSAWKAGRIQNGPLQKLFEDRASEGLATRHPASFHPEYDRVRAQSQQKMMERWRDRHLSDAEVTERDDKVVSWCIRGWMTDLGPTLNAEFLRMKHLYLYDVAEKGALPAELKRMLESEENPVLKCFKNNYRKMSGALQAYCKQAIAETRASNSNYTFDQAVHLTLESILADENLSVSFKDELAELQGGVIASILEKTSLGPFKSEVNKEFPKLFVKAYHEGTLPRDTVEVFEEKYRGNFLKKNGDQGDPNVYREVLRGSSETDSILEKLDLQELFPEAYTLLKEIHNALYSAAEIK